MGTTDVALGRIFVQLAQGNAGLAIMELETNLAAWPNPQTKEKLDLLHADYRRLEECWKAGIQDPQQPEQYLRLLQRAYVLASNISIHRHMMSSSYLQQLYKSVRIDRYSWQLSHIKEELQNFVSETAMLELEPEHQRSDKELALNQQHQQLTNRLFLYILTSHMWTVSVGEGMEEILLLPTIDSRDQQLVVSAIMLSLMNRFDIVKFRLLTRVYQQSHDRDVRQRALVGWALSVDDDFSRVYPEQQLILKDMLQQPRVCQELTELQLQLLYTLNADADSNKIKQEIMPELMKGQNFRVTRFGIEEIEEDPLEDVLHPDAAERRMERVEESFQRMMDMQRQGADIYFGGFSQMKRFPFFYDMSNWFVPFYLQHPDISQFVKNTESIQVLKQILGRGAFCNSDKYSFVIAFQQVVDMLPADIKKMMKRGEAVIEETMENKEQQSTAFVRRSYLMDVYRFFMLFPNRAALRNPFDMSRDGLLACFFFNSRLFCDTPLDDYKPQVLRILRKYKQQTMMMALLDSYPERLKDCHYWLLKGRADKAYELEPHNEVVLAQLAKEFFKYKKYSDADAIYAELIMLHPEKMSYMLNRSVCLLEMEEYDDALKLLYQLSYEHENNRNVQRVMAWAFTCCDKLEQADNIYRQLLAQEKPETEDHINYGLCLWLQGKIVDAAQQFSHIMTVKESSEENKDKIFDIQWLMKHGITETNIQLMKALSMDSMA